MYPRNDDRFLFPFLLGGLAGGAVVGLSRPRPVFVNPVPRPYYGSYYNYYPYYQNYYF